MANNTFSYSVTDDGGLIRALERADKFEVVSLINDHLTNMYNRAEISNDPAHGGTPWDTGELSRSKGVTGATGSQLIAEGEFGYAKEYALHVEMGHVTVGGGYVQGQYYVKNNYEIEMPLISEDALQRIQALI